LIFEPEKLNYPAMKIIIPAAGEGTRLRPHTYTQTKVLLNVAGKPILGHILDPLVRLKPSKVVFIVSSNGEKIADFVRRNYRFKAHFVRQDKPLGLGYAVSLAKSEFDREPVLIILGDTIVEPELFKKMENRFDWLGVKEVEDPHRFGIAEVKNGIVKKLVEKPESPKGNLALVGLYHIKSVDIFRACLEEILHRGVQTKGEFQLTDALQLMIDRGVKFRTVRVKEWYDCGKIETLLETNKRLLEKKRQRAPHFVDSLVLPPVYVAKSAEIRGSIVGPNVTVLEEAMIHNSIVKNSILSEGCRVQNAILENSLIGQNARVHGKVKSINLGDSSEIGV
jgi:glucose-1-phosphate thymidylyltransferase